jgi:hypothetical protein
MRPVSKALLGIAGALVAMAALLTFWLFVAEPYMTERRLLGTLGAETKTVGQLLDEQSAVMGGRRWKCIASDILVQCTIITGNSSVEYLWGVDSKGFYPANGRTLKMCPALSRGISASDFGEDETIPGAVFSRQTPVPRRVP